MQSKIHTKTLISLKIYIYTSFLAYITGQLPGLHGVHGLLIDALIVALQVAVVLLFVFDLFQKQKGGDGSACRPEQLWI